MIATRYFVLLGVLLLSVGCGPKQGPAAPPHVLHTRRPSAEEPPQVDKTIRARAAKLHAEDIKELRFTGVQFMRFSDDPIIIQDKQEIGRYITALRHSYCRSLGFANGVNILEVVFASHNGKEPESQLFFFNLSHDLDCFGPEFRKEALALQGRTAQKDKSAPGAKIDVKGARARRLGGAPGLKWVGQHGPDFVPARLFTISNVKNNDVLPNEILVEVSTSNTYTYGDVTLMVDGTEVAWGGSSTIFGRLGPVQLDIATDTFANGTHLLTARDILGNTDTRMVTFRNQFENTSVDAIFDVTPGVKDVPSTCTISSTLARSQPWTVRIETDDPVPVTLRTYSGNSAAIHVVWDGKDARGKDVPNEPHAVVLTCRNQTIKSVTNKDRLGP